MDAEFWHRRWRKNEIAFHEGEANALLVRHFKGSFGRRGSRVLLPLCGKTRDIAWLMSEGYPVVGAELSGAAVDQLFVELGVEPDRIDLGKLTLYKAAGIDIFVGDIFDLSGSVLGEVDVIYDRAALVALPGEMRERYAGHLMEMTGRAPQFVICFDYDQTQMDGPPFSVTGEEVRRCYGDHYDMKQVTSIDVVGGLKGKCAAAETLWLLQPKPREGL